MQLTHKNFTVRTSNDVRGMFYVSVDYMSDGFGTFLTPYGLIDRPTFLRVSPEDRFPTEQAALDAVRAWLAETKGVPTLAAAVVPEDW